MINFGALGIKRSSAQITKLYAKEELLNRQVAAVVNFHPKRVANFVSECLVLAVVNSDEVILLSSERDAPLGLRIM